jgi:hypothetical protein
MNASAKLRVQGDEEVDSIDMEREEAHLGLP